jgi:hypothetical protein
MQIGEKGFFGIGGFDTPLSSQEKPDLSLHQRAAGKHLG